MDNIDKTKFNKLLLEWQGTQKPRKVDEDEPKIKIHQIVSSINWLYERFRMFIDNQHGGNEFYRSIKRTLKRLLLIEKRKPEKIPLMLISELIGSGYLENDVIPKRYLNDVWKILDKYVILMNKIKLKIRQSVVNKNISSFAGRKKIREINNWLVFLASREIESFLIPQASEDVIVDSMYDFMLEQIQIDDERISEQDKKSQIYIAVNRAYLKSSDDILFYYLFRQKYPNWNHAEEADLEEIAKNIFVTKGEIQDQLDHPVKFKLKKLCLNYVVYFILLSEMLHDLGATGLARLVKNQEELEKKIQDFALISYKKARKRIWIGLFKSTIYVLVTKYAVIDYPMSVGLVNISEFEHLVILLLGPVLMFFVGMSIGKPSSSNTNKIIKVFKRIVFEDRLRNVPYIVKHVVKRSFITNLLFVFFYLILFVSIIILIYIVFGFYGFDVLITSIALLFFSMISYFGFRLREIMRKYIVLDKKENFIVFIFDFLSLPILKLGRWLSEFFKTINFVPPLFDYFIETPFKASVSFFDSWTFFVKEKKEELEKGEH
jgi:hypothetical protein